MPGAKDTATCRDIAEILSISVGSRLFPDNLELIPQLNEVYELELAFCESQILTPEEIIRNGAYFARVDNTLTRHFLMCSGEPVRLPQYSSSRLKSFFEANQFKTGYATHGLFPYRGKFHPQMVKGLLNAMGLKPGDTVLDPMMGSGTVLIEARLMGIKSIGIDASPFCRFMTQVKLDALTVPLAPLKAALNQSKTVFEHFRKIAGNPQPGVKSRNHEAQLQWLLREPGDTGLAFLENPAEKLPDGCGLPEVHNLLLLAYLDSAGYAERSNRRPPYDQFRAVLERYLFVCEKIQRVLSGTESELAEATALEGDARALPLADESVDGILFSPPYSFAIDYLENDSFHLGFMGVDTEKLREKMVGLRGKTLREKYELYRSDMDKVLSECARVLRPERICSVVVGTNNNQLARTLRVTPDAVPGTDELLIELAARHGLHLVRKLSRQITGIANTMRNEFILMFQRR